MAVNERSLLKYLTLVIIVAIATSSQLGTAAANVPTIVSIFNDTHGGNPGVPWTVAIRVTISHTPSTPDDYVDQVEVTFDGTVQSPYTLDKSVQTSSPFTVRLELATIPSGGDQGHVITARAHSTADGWSAPTSSMNVPEFPIVPFVTFIALAGSLLAIRYGRRSQAFAPLS